MKVHEIKLPQEIIVGSNVIQYTGKICKRLGLKKKIIIITGPHVKKIAGEKISEILTDEGIENSIYITKVSKMTEVDKIIKETGKDKADAIIGAGGGRVIDIAKMVAFKKNVPCISVPTAASHDGIASPRASLKELNGPTSIAVNPPMAIIADSKIIKTAKYRLLASGCADIIAKFTAVRDWKLAHKLKGEYYGEYAASLALMSANLIVEHAIQIPKMADEDVRTVIEALISCGVSMCIAGSSRPCSGSEHLFSHALDMIAKKPALHGEQCGVGTIMMMYLHGGDWKMVRDALKTIGAPTNAKELGISEEEVIKALTIANKIRPNRYTILGEKEIRWEVAEKIAKITGVIQ